MVCSSFSAELTENEPSNSTQNSGFFGYFGNLWNKKPLPSTPPTHLTSEQPVGIFDHVKNWMNVIKDKMPGKIQTTTSSVNSFNILKTKSVKKIHPTVRIKNRKPVSSNISSSPVRNIKRRADTDIPGTAESFTQSPVASDSISSQKNFYSSYEYFIGRHEERITSLKQEPAIANISSSTVSAIDENPIIKTHSTTTIPVSLSTDESINTESNLSVSTVEPGVKPNPFAFLGKQKNDADLSFSIPDALNRSTTKRHFKGYKLTPLFISFYNADDLTGNSSKREVQFPLPAFLNYSTRIRTRKSRASRMSRRTKSTQSKSMTNDSNRSVSILV